MRAAIVICLLGWPLLAPADAVREALDACLRTVDARVAAKAAPKAASKVAPNAVPNAPATGAAKVAASANKDQAQTEDVAKLCPELRPALEDSEYGPWLTREWWEELHQREQLVELDRLLTQSSQVPASATPDLKGVSSVLEGMQTQEAQRKGSIWERFVRWIDSRLRNQNKETPPWLEEWLRKIDMPSGSARTVSRVLMVLVVIGALLAILNELRAAGVFGKRVRRGKAVTEAQAAAAGNAGPLSLAEIEGRALLSQPSLLLDLVLRTLARAQRAAGDTSLTHRQLKTAVHVDGERYQARFEELVGCAERTRYAGVEPAEQELAGAVAAGRELLHDLKSARPNLKPAEK